MKRLLLVLTALGCMAFGRAQDCNCMIELDDTFSVVPMNIGQAPDYRNDDGFSVAITLPFTFTFFGTEHTSVFINNNGNLSFASGYSNFVASGFPINIHPMVSAYWADVDTRNPESGLVYYKVLDNALIVRYHEVGYFPQMADQVNDFQMILTDGTSELVGNGHTISFCYGDMQWSTGTAATVGANAGDDVNALQIGRFNENAEAYDGPYGNPDNVDFLDFSNISFTTNLLSENQQPINVSNYCDTIFGFAGDTLMFYFYDDGDDDLVFDVDDTSGYFDPNDTIDGMILFNGDLVPFRTLPGERSEGDHTIALIIDPNIPDGLYEVIIHATDQGTPALTSSYTYRIQIGDGSVGVAEKPQPTVIPYLQSGILRFTGIEGLPVEQFTLYNTNGQNILQATTVVQGIDMNYMPSGVYLFTLRINGQPVHGRFVK
ncbi:MAG: T9SS type A sorting domain-containing protein [Flavobacteriales bacterium]